MPREQLPRLKALPLSERSSLRLAYDDFILSRQAMRCSPKTLAHYSYTIGGFLAYLERCSVARPEQVKASHVRAYLADLQRRGVKDTTLHAHARGVKTFLRFLHAERYIPEPITVQTPRLDKRILPALSPEDVKRLLAICERPRDSAAVLCLLDTGLRASEFCALDVGDVDVRTGAVQVRRGKGGKGRVAFLGARARKALLKYLMARGEVRPDEPLWLSENTGARLTHHGLRLLLKRLGKRANVQHCHPHTFRRTFALWSLRAGMNVYALQQIMGHSDLSILRRYLALVEQDLADAHRKHGAVDNML